MVYTTVSVSPHALNSYQRDYLVKSGFGVMGTVFLKTVKADELHIVINQLVTKNISFGLKSMAVSNNTSKPCVGCKK